MTFIDLQTFYSTALRIYCRFGDEGFDQEDSDSESK
jgi:hypothetical protein